MQACIIGLSINEDLKLEKGKGKNGSTAQSYIQSSGHVTALYYYVMAICQQSAAIYQCCNITPPSKKACPQALYVRITPIGYSYLYTLLVAYYLYYTSILSIYLGTLAV